MLLVSKKISDLLSTRSILRSFIISFVWLVFISCSVATLEVTNPTAENTGAQVQQVTFVPLPKLSDTIEASPSPTNVISPAPAKTPTTTNSSIINQITATVWRPETKFPILIYHRFLPDSYERSYPTKLRLGDFQRQLEIFDENGYSLLSLEDWLTGNWQLPDGRRPLIFTMDDGFFADQIFLNPDGSPSEKSGIGLLWYFSQKHPKFGFSMALFANMGDKLYSNVERNDWFYTEDGWKEALSRALIWSIEHDVMPYNHLYSHPQLNITEGKFLQSQMRMNDDEIIKLLIKSGRRDLVMRIDNIVALPYGIWPRTEAGKQLIMDYFSPQGYPMMAIMEAGDAIKPAYNFPPYQPEFDRWHVARIPAVEKAVELLVTNKELFPPVFTCTLTVLDNNNITDELRIKVSILQTIQAGLCPAGIYSINGSLYQSTRDQVSRIEYFGNQIAGPVR